MKRSISILGGILLALALMSPAWAHPGKGKGGGGGGPTGPTGPTGPGGGGEPQAGGLPGLEDRVEADEALIATLQTQVSTLMTEVTALQGAVSTLQGQVAILQGQNNFATVSSACAVVSSSSSAGAVTATPGATGLCTVTFSKDVAACAAQATIVGSTGGEISVTSTTKTIVGDSFLVSTFVPAGIPANAAFNLTVTCP
jgi:hypothetical protein